MPNWNEVYKHINQHVAVHQQQAHGAVDHFRRAYLAALHKHTDRNVIAYYSGWLNKPGVPGVSADIVK